MKSKHLRLEMILALTMLSAISAPAQEPEAQTKDNAISGRVVSESGQPLSGVNVSLSVIGSNGGQRTTTDNEGNFKVQGLDGGIYRIFLSSPGYVIQFPSDSMPSYRPGETASLTLVKGGVIAGTVTNMAGDAVVNINVRAYQVRDAEGKKLATPAFAQPKFTDDRGYFRIYGLQPGTYVVAAGGQGPYYGSVNPFANDSMTYAPASTRDTAMEIVVRSDAEATADIRYRGEPGHAVSGKISGVPSPPPFSPSVRLIDVDSRVMVAGIAASGPDRTFQLSGISDGEYEISGIGGGGPNVDMVASPPRRISVKGADVTGLDLALAVMGSIEGRVNIEADAKLNCGRRRDTTLRETIVALRRSRPEEKAGAPKDKTEPAEISSTFVTGTPESVPNDKGEIRFRNLSSANYRFDIRLTAAGWYLRDITAGAADKTVNIPRNGITLRSGEKVSGLTIAVAEGGASLRGRITTTEGQSLPPALRLYLVPAERESTENTLRFFEAEVANDGSFAVGNLSPGRYWLIAETTEDTDPKNLKSIRNDIKLRAKIMREAESSKKEIEFKPCQRTVDYELPYSSSKQ